MAVVAVAAAVVEAVLVACVVSVPVRSERNFTFGAGRKMG